MGHHTASTRDSNLPDATATLKASTLPWDCLRHPIWLFDPETCRGLYANPPAMALWDAKTLDELLARDFTKLSPAVRTRTERLARATAHGECITERWTFYPKGQPVTVQAVISAYVQADGRSALLFEATPIDVEDGERRAVEALRHTSSLITLFTSNGIPIFSNPATTATYGDAVGFRDRFSDGDYGNAVLKAVQSSKILAELVEVSTLRGTRSHHIDVRQVLDPVTGEISILLSERDVTAQVEAERSLLLAEERAAAAIAKQSFLSNVSHEFRTPLTSVLGYSALLLADETLPKEARGSLDRIVAAGESLLRIVNSVILLDEIDKGEIEIQPTVFSLNDLIQEVNYSSAPSATRKGLEFRNEHSHRDDLFVASDKGKILAILEIFATNAVRFTQSGEVVIGVNVKELSESSVYVSIYVKDTGPGIEQGVQKLIFNRFDRAEQGRSSTGGSGFRLAVAKSLAHLLGGEIEVTSSLGKGATFSLSLRLPLVGGATQTLITFENRDCSGTPAIILYADDHENNRVLVSSILCSQGYICDLAEDGQQALEAIKNNRYDLILMDIQMPVMDGVEATRAVRAANFQNDVPIIALTANTLQHELKLYEAAGINNVIAKPINIAGLLNKVAHWSDFARTRSD